MQIPVLPAGMAPGEGFDAPKADDPPYQPQPTLTVLPGGGDTTDPRATLHAVPGRE